MHIGVGRVEARKEEEGGMDACIAGRAFEITVRYGVVDIGGEH